MENLKNEILDYFKDLSFNEKYHKYSLPDPSIYLPSVSGVLKKHVPDTDFKKLAYYVARKENRTVEEVIAEWDKKRDDAAADGTRVHKYAEDYDGTQEPNCEKTKLVKHYYDTLPENIVVLIKELRMYHKDFMYAGTADLILLNTDTGNLIIGDFKTNKDLDKSYNTLLSPLHNFSDSAYNKYQLQLNYYQLMLEQTGYTVEDRQLIWLNPEDYQIRSCEDLTERLLNCFN